jgi:hypothetical protein
LRLRLIAALREVTPVIEVRADGVRFSYGDSALTPTYKSADYCGYAYCGSGGAMYDVKNLKSQGSLSKKTDATDTEGHRILAAAVHALAETGRTADLERQVFRVATFEINVDQPCLPSAP